MANYDPDRVEKPQNTPMMPQGDGPQPIPKDYDSLLPDGIDVDRARERYQKAIQERNNQLKQLAGNPDTGE